MKTKAQAKKHNFWRGTLDWLRFFIKTLRTKFSLKRKSFEPFPKESPH